MVPVVFLSVVVGCRSYLGGIVYTAYSFDMLVHFSLHADPLKVASDHVDHSADALVSLGIVELYNDKGC